MRDTRRLDKRFKRDDQAEILLPIAGGSAWRVCRVIAYDPPGLWVMTADGARWWVTNGARIRPSDQADG